MTSKRRVTELKEQLSEGLEDAIRTSEEAVLGVGKHIAEIANLAREQVAETARLARELGQGSAMVKTLDDQSRTVDGYLEQVSHKLEVHRQIAQEVAEQLDQIRHAGARIEEMAHESRVVNINARIEAARLGKLGKPFAVIAEQMSALASDVDSTNRMVGELAKALSELVPRMAQSSDELAEATSAFASDYRRSNGALSQAQLDLGEVIRSSLGQGEQRTQAILSGSQDAMGLLSFQDPLAQSLRSLPDYVEETLEPGSPGRPPTQRLSTASFRRKTKRISRNNLPTQSDAGLGEGDFILF